VRNADKLALFFHLALVRSATIGVKLIRKCFYNVAGIHPPSGEAIAGQRRSRNWPRTVSAPELWLRHASSGCGFRIVTISLRPARQIRRRPVREM